MSKVSDLIKKFTENPENLELLPELLKAAEDLEVSEANAMLLVEKTQASNRNLLAQIIAQPDPKKEEPEKTYTLRDVDKSLTEELKKELNL